MKYVTPNEAAEIMGINPACVRSMIASGKLVASNISQSAARPRWRISVDDIASFMDSRKHTAVKTVRRKRNSRFDGIRQYV